MEIDPASVAKELGYATQGITFVVKKNTRDLTYCALDTAGNLNELAEGELAQVSAGVDAGTAGSVGSAGSAATAGSVCTTFSSASSAGSVGSVGTFAV